MTGLVRTRGPKRCAHLCARCKADEPVCPPPWGPAHRLLRPVRGELRPAGGGAARMRPGYRKPRCAWFSNLGRAASGTGPRHVMTARRLVPSRRWDFRCRAASCPRPVVRPSPPDHPCRRFKSRPRRSQPPTGHPLGHPVRAASAWSDTPAPAVCVPHTRPGPIRGADGSVPVVRVVFGGRASFDPESRGSRPERGPSSPRSWKGRRAGCSRPASTLSWSADHGPSRRTPRGPGGRSTAESEAWCPRRVSQWAAGRPGWATQDRGPAGRPTAATAQAPGAVQGQDRERVRGTFPGRAAPAAYQNARILPLGRNSSPAARMVETFAICT